MLKLGDEHWARIRERFAEENIPDGRPGRKPIPTREVLGSFVDPQHRGTMAHAAAVVSELQNSSSAFSAVVSKRSVA